jgi:hypothetical protein
MKTPNLASYAVDYLKRRLSCVRCDPVTKEPVGTWKQYQRASMNPEEAKQKYWEGIGILCGKVSDNLEILDFDFKADFFKQWRNLVEIEAPGITNRVLIQTTQSGGNHIAYRCPEIEIPGSHKLSHEKIMVDGPGEHEFQGKKLTAQKEEDGHYIYPCMIETRGEGAYFLAAPTPGYEITSERSFLDIPVITAEERVVLIRAAKALNKKIDKAQVIKEPQHSSSPAGQRPGDIYNQQADIRPLLESHGWVQDRTNGEFEYWTRPGKNRGVSASLIDGKVFYVFTTNAPPLEPEKAYSKFNLYSYLEHNGDYSAAARKLADMGFRIDTPTAGVSSQNNQENKLGWAKAREIIPRVAYPWVILPADLSDSLRALAQSCATDADSLPGTAMAMIAAAVGRKLSITPKQGWNEPIVLWLIDIRESGEGKTPVMWLLAKVLKKVQQKAHDDYEEELEKWEDKPKKDRGKPPDPPTGYFITDLTLEGLRTDLEHHPTGGIVVLLNEASTLISGQNQYKQKGTDREAWLKLHDGQPARIVRAAKKFLISEARVQVVGGIQPGIFQRVFGGDQGQYLEDGTVFRCLFNFTPPGYHDLTSDTWHEHHRSSWETILERALQWGRTTPKPHHIHLTQEAQDWFFEWRNRLHRQRFALPNEVKGFLPKTYGHALRLAAVIECLHAFHNDTQPRAIIDLQGIQRGIDAAMYYLGQAVDAVRLLAGGEQAVNPTKIKILDALRDAGPMTSTQINNDVFKRNMPASQIQSAIEALKLEGEVEELTEPTEGRPRTLIRLVRNIVRSSEHQEPPDKIDFSLNSLNSSVHIEEAVEDEEEV